jgi:TRAP-type transport system periplasmic protein
MEIKRLNILVGCIGLIIVLVSLTFLGGCSSSPASTSVTTTTAASTTTSATATTPVTTKTSTSTSTSSSTAANQIVLKYAPASLQSSPVLGQTLTVTEQFKLIQDRANGKLKVDIYWSQALVKATDLASAISSGLADMTHLRPYSEPGKLTLSTVGEMPGVSDDQWALVWAYWDLINQEPLVSELGKFKARPIWTLLTQELQIVSKTPIRTLADLKGKKINAGGIGGEELKLLGATILNMSPVEQSEALLRGTIDAIAAPYDAAYSFKFYESGKYITNISLGPRVQPVVMNQDTWKNLPADMQKVFTDSAADCINISYTSIIKETNDIILKEMKAANVEFIDLNAADKATIRKMQADYGDKWAAAQDAAGLAGTKVLADYRKLVAKYEPLSPYKK